MKTDLNSLKISLIILTIIIIIAFALGLIVKQSDYHNSVLSVSTAPTQFGFGTDLIIDSNNDLDLDQFKANVDLLVQKNVKWIKFTFKDVAHVVHPNTNLDITWNETNLSLYDQATTYAKQKGLNVYTVSTIPMGDDDPGPVTLTIPQLTTISQNFYSYLTNRFGNKIDVWQIFNEVDCHNFRDNATLPIGDMNAQYLSDLNTLIGASRTTIRSINFNALITTNTCGEDYNADIRLRITTFFDGIKNSLDLVSINIFPKNTNFSAMLNASTGLTAFINTLTSRYSKSVTISEVGLCTSTSNQTYIDLGYTEAGQNDYLIPTINALKAANPMILNVKEIQDEKSNLDCGYGIIKFNRTNKLAANTIFTALLEQCSSFTYTNWGSCVNEIQNRSVTLSYPSGCIQGSFAAPVLTQSCSNQCASYAYSDWSKCIDGQQFREVVTSFPNGCSGAVTSPTLSRSCTACTSYVYGNFGSCRSGTKIRDVVTSYPLGCVEGEITSETALSCIRGIPCKDIVLSEWGACDHNVERRSIISTTPGDCDTTDVVLARLCDSLVPISQVAQSTNPIVLPLAIAIIIGTTGTALALIRIYKKRQLIVNKP